MKVFATSDIRNVTLIGHGDSGKTSLASALIFAGGAESRLGSVDDGSATTDFDEEETERKISLQAAVAHVAWNGKKINIVDTPGYAAFAADGKVALAASDTAMLLVEAVSGVQVMTERTFDWAEEFSVPLVLVVNKLDRENASFDTCLASIQERFGRTALPLQLPIGSEHDFEGVIDLIKMKAHTFAKDGSGKVTTGDIPAELADAAGDAHSAMVEMVAETDDALMEAFFEAGDLSPEQLLPGLRAAIVSRKIFPVLCSAATHMTGTRSIMDFIVDLCPAPDARGAAMVKNPADGSDLERPVSDDEPVALFVFKTMADPFAGKLSIFRVISGVLKTDSHVVNVGRENHPERLGGLLVMQGKATDPVDALHSGDIGVVAKLKETRTSDTLADPAHPILYPPVTFRDPAISYAVEPKSQGDEEKISSALARMMDEDPVLRLKRDARTGELLVSGTSQVHVEVTLAKMKRKFGVQAILHPPKVPYLETITKKVENVEATHKKQSGGRGQYGKCTIHLEPLPRGGGIEFVDKIFGGSIPQNFRPAVDKGIRETAERGWQANCPVVDFRVTLVDGKHHNVDSSEMAFKIAGSQAFKEAMSKAGPTILEPIMAVEITAPEENMGDVMGDLSQRRGKPQGMEASGHYQVIKAQVPMAEMLEYASTLKSITSDRASYTMEFDHYQPAPSHIRQEIAAEAAKANEQKAG